MREFACHSAVILAQPRVSRLRADAVYVDQRRPTGARPGTVQIVDFKAQVWRGDPLVGASCGSMEVSKPAAQVPKMDLSVNEIWPPFWLLMWVHGGIETKNNSFPTANATHLPRRKTTQNGVPPLSFTGIKCATFAQEGPGGSRKGGGPPV